MAAVVTSSSMAAVVVAVVIPTRNHSRNTDNLQLLDLPQPKDRPILLTRMPFMEAIRTMS